MSSRASVRGSQQDNSQLMYRKPIVEGSMDSRNAEGRSLASVSNLKVINLEMIHCHSHEGCHLNKNNEHIWILLLEHFEMRKNVRYCIVAVTILVDSTPL